ncbi:MAG: hypothetical protein LW875_05740 [Proteobacteria bacterium]|nr:hypothetical protein [Pseudomonadota bacterium]
MIRQLVALTLGLFLFSCLGFAQTQLPRKKVTSAMPAASAEITSTTVPSDSGVTAEGAPILNFNTEGVPSNTDKENRGFIFKVPTTEAEKKDTRTARPIESIPDTAFKVNPGYPKQELEATYRPGSVGFKTTYQSTDLNVSNNITSSAGALYRLRSTPELYFEAEYNMYSTSVNAKNGIGLFNIKKSTAMIDSLMARGNYCFLYENFYRRLCPGVEVGYDSSPAFEFQNGTDLKLAQVKDMVVGANVVYQTPVAPSWILDTKLAYYMGLANGQNSRQTVKSNSRLLANLGINYQRKENQAVVAGVSFENREAKTKGKAGVITDEFTTKSTAIFFRAGYRWEF